MRQTDRFTCPECGGCPVFAEGLGGGVTSCYCAKCQHDWRQGGQICSGNTGKKRRLDELDDVGAVVYTDHKYRNKRK